MTRAGESQLFRRMDQFDVAVCAFLNRACRQWWVTRFFAAVSRLGDGVIWYVIVIAIPVFAGSGALPAFLDMITVGVLGVSVYKLVKPRVVRDRPFAAHPDIHMGAAPLDEYSFPSGHTLHAVGFTIVATNYYPELVWFMLPFTVLVAASRVVLGLHYPTDVLAGAAIGGLLALATLGV
jgi:undecaprenyl-diphosphatase